MRSVGMKPYKRNIFQRLLGIPATKKPRDELSWVFAHDEIVLDLNRVPELEEPGGGIRLNATVSS